MKIMIQYKTVLGESKMEILFLESLLILNNEYYSIQDSIIDKEKLCFKMLHSPLCGSLKILDYAKHYVKNKAFLDLSNYDKIMYLFQKVIDELLEKYRYDLLKKLVEREKENYQKQDSFAFLNHSGVKRILRTFKDAPSKVKKEYESLKIKKVINITILYLNAIDPTLKLQNIFLEALKNQSICLWDIYGSIVPSKILQYLAINEVFCWKTVSQETVFLNGPCEGNILDVYSLIHEFFHYVTFWAEENTKMSSCESFFTEVASIFHEKKLREFLKMIQYPSKDIDAISIFRKEGNNNCLPLLNSLYQLMELKNFNEEHLKQ